MARYAYIVYKSINIIIHIECVIRKRLCDELLRCVKCIFTGLMVYRALPYKTLTFIRIAQHYCYTCTYTHSYWHAMHSHPHRIRYNVAWQSRSDLLQYFPTLWPHRSSIISCVKHTHINTLWVKQGSHSSSSSSSIDSSSTIGW